MLFRSVGIESVHDLMSSKFGSYGEMNNAWTAASEEMYKATQQTGGQPGGGDANGGQQANAGGENVTDAEFEEVK